MDLPKYSKTDPAVMLLNEIEILLAQTRLMELYLEQAQAAAAHENAIIHEQHQAELGALRSALAENERTLAAALTAGNEKEKTLREQIRALEHQVAEREILIARRDAELGAAERNIAELNERIGQLGQAHQQLQAADREDAMLRQSMQTELLALRHQLQTNQEEFQTQQTISRELQEKLRTELAQLQAQLEAKQAHSQTISTQLEEAKGEAAALSQQITELHASSYQAQASAAQELKQARTCFEAEVTSLQTALADRDRSLRDNENAFAEAKHGLKTEIVALRSQLEQRQELIEFRDDELRDAQGQLTALQQRIVELESSHDSMVANTEQIDSLRRSYENEIAALQREVAAKEQALSQRQEAATAVELALHGKIHELQEELARSRKVESQLEDKLQQTGAEAASLQRQLGELAAAAAATDQTAQLLLEEKNHSRELDAELTRLHAILAQTEYAVRERESFSRSLEERFGSEINQLRNELEERQKAVQSTGAEVVRLQAELGALREQNSQSEIVRRQLTKELQDAASQREVLANHLRAKEDELQAVQVTALKLQAAALKERECQFESSREQLSAEINSLRAQLEEQQMSSEQGRAETKRLLADFAELQTRYSRLQLSHSEVEENWRRAVVSQQELTAGLGQKEQELAIANELKAQFDAATGELQLKLTEKSLLAESRGAEIGNLKSDIQRLSVQLAQRESVASQATADFHRELESIRATHQAEVSALQERHRVSQEDFDKQLAQEKQSVADLRAQIEEVELRAREGEANLKDRDESLHAAESEVATLQARVRELETMGERERAAAGNDAEQARVRFEAELASLRDELQQKASALAQQQAAVENLALTHRSEIQNVEAKLAEQQGTVQDWNLEIEKGQSEICALRQRLEDLTADLRRAQSMGSAQTEQIRRSQSQIDDLSKQLAQRTAEIEASTASQSVLEQSLRSEIDRLIAEAREKNQILQDRNDEVVRVKAEMDLLLDKVNQLESSASQAEANLTGESEQMRTEFQAQLALLQAELSQKEWTIEEQRAVSSGTEQQLRHELETFRQQMCEMESRAKEAHREFVIGDGELSEERRVRFKKSEDELGSISKVEPSFPASENRRWHNHFGWKRRWRSS